MAKPTSAFFKAGASFVPSPVTATTFPLSINPVTKAYLSSGLDLESTSSLSIILSNSSPFKMVSFLIGTFFYLASSGSVGQSHILVLQFMHTTPPTRLMKSSPFIAMESLLSAEIIPHSIAIALAVNRLSPVTILTLTPANLHY
jgi:hypothetical protein